VITYLSRARATLRARTTDRPAADEGFTLIYTLLVITLVTVLVGSALVVAAANVVPATRTAHALAADAAARSGIDAFMSRLEQDCPTSNNPTVANCTPSSTTVTNQQIDSDSATGYTASYSYTATKSAGNTWFRVTSTGKVKAGTDTVTKTLVADISGGSSTNLYSYNQVVGYETQAPDVVMGQFPQRTITLNGGARSAAKLPSSATSVTWAGAQNGSTAGTVNICNALYAGTNGRAHNAPPGATTPYVDWLESGSAGGNSYSNYQPCQVSLGHSTKLEKPSAAQGTGGYASHDALLLSNSFPGGSGPLLNQPVWTGYQYDPTSATACDSPNQDYRSFNLVCAGYSVEIGGSPASGSTYTPTYLSSLPNVPTGATVPATGSCVYSGPTRVYLNADGTATITSPQTTAAIAGSPSACYPSTVSTGIYQYRTPVLSTISGFNGIISVKNHGTAPATTPSPHSGTGWNLTGQKSTSTASSADTVFYADSGVLPTASDPTGSFANESGCSSTGYSSSNVATCAWTGVKSTTDGNVSGTTRGWTSYTAGTGCGSALASTDRLAFECDFNGGSVGSPHDYYGIFRNRVEIDLARSTCLTGSTTTQQTCLKTFLENELNPANTSTHRYVVTASTPVTTATSTKTLSTNSAPLTGDPLFDSTSSPGSPTVESLDDTTYTFTISRQVYKCYGVVLGGLCLLGGSVIGNQWGSDSTAGASTPQFTVTVTNQTASLTSAGSVGKSYFPSMQDVTQYAVGPGGANGTTGPGDLYVEGTAASTISLVAQDDVVVTGSVQPSTNNAAVQLVALDNARVYHPVKCTSTDTSAIASTTAGYCPNDITGLYSGVPAAADRPDQQYANLRDSGSTSLSDLTIGAAVFAIGGTTPSALCPLWSGAGTCGGEFSVDNYNRGSGLGTLTVQGTLVMEHHGPVGREWEITDTTGQTSRPHSGYQLDLQYQNLQTLLAANSSIAGVVTTQSTSSALWHLVSISTGA